MPGQRYAKIVSEKPCGSNLLTMNNSQPALTIYPRRRPQITTLIICLLVLALVGDVITYILQTSYGIGVDILFAVLLLLCLVFLSGFVWSALRLLTSGQP